jgi:glycosyltransferase involved in cell wall biosynthesis
MASSNIGRAASFGIECAAWESESKAGDRLLRASHFVPEPEEPTAASQSARNALRGIVAGRKPDVVVACMYPVGMLALPVVQDMGVPLVVHHQLMYKDLPDHPIIKPVLRASRYAAKIIAASEATAVPLRRSGISNVEVIRADLPDTYANGKGAKRTAEPPIILAVGTWGPVKGLDYLVEAADRLHAAGRKFRLDVVGPLGEYGWDYESLIRCASRAGVERGYIRLHGPSSDPRDFYAGADIFVVPSSEPDPFPSVTLEAMAHGLPVVATAVGGLVEQVVEGETGFLVYPCDPAALAGACGRLLDSPELAQRLGNRGRALQRENSVLGSQSAEFARVLEEAVRLRGVPAAAALKAAA